ncbi:MAG: hypothetical protein KBB11_06460 [Bacteroidales bacterium]|nr:hypothetical protein [Bacteroidales bacterium]HQP04673.1 hypothetical protein [Bacteroidales bacterium]
MSQNNVWQGKTDGGNLGQKALFLYFKYGSIILAYAITAVVTLFYLVFHIRATRSIWSYFRKRQKLTWFNSVFSTYKNHFIFGMTLIDRFAIFAGRQKEYKIEIIGEQLYNELVDNPEKGFLVVNSHIGSAEIAGYLLGQDKKRINALIFAGEAKVYQRYRKNIMTPNNIHLIPVIDSFSHFIEVHLAAKNAEIIAVAADRIYNGSTDIRCSLMGSEAKFPVNPFQIAEKLKLPVLAFFNMRTGFKKYTFHVFRLDIYGENGSNTNSAKDLLKAYVMKIEEILQKYPLQWFNFYNFWA